MENAVLAEGQLPNRYPDQELTQVSFSEIREFGYCKCCRSRVSRGSLQGSPTPPPSGQAAHAVKVRFGYGRFAARALEIISRCGRNPLREPCSENPIFYRYETA